MVEHPRKKYFPLPDVLYILDRIVSFELASRQIVTDVRLKYRANTQVSSTTSRCL